MSSDAMQELARRSKAVYDARLRQRLEAEARGKFVAIEPDSGDYYLGNTLSEAIGASRKSHPDKLAYAMRIGESAAVKIGTKL